MKIKHLFFDLDRTIWDYENNCNEVLQDLFNIYVFDKADKTFSTIDFIKAFHVENKILWDLFTENKIDKDFLRKNRFFRTLNNLGIDNQKLADNLEMQYLSITPQKKKLMPLVVPVLQELNKNFKLHIITNGFEDVQNFKLQNCELNHLFEKVITSDGANARKPNREIFDCALSKSGADISESIMIGDDFEIDIKPANRLGWKSIYYNIQSKENIIYKDNLVEINSYEEFDNALKHLLQ
jgi:putative hydrolase of the HAD superfamily